MADCIHFCGGDELEEGEIRDDEELEEGEIREDSPQERDFIRSQEGHYSDADNIDRELLERQRSGKVAKDSPWINIYLGETSESHGDIQLIDSPLSKERLQRTIEAIPSITTQLPRTPEGHSGETDNVDRALVELQRREKIARYSSWINAYVGEKSESRGDTQLIDSPLSKERLQRSDEPIVSSTMHVLRTAEPLVCRNGFSPEELEGTMDRDDGYGKTPVTVHRDTASSSWKVEEAAIGKASLSVKIPQAENYSPERELILHTLDTLKALAEQLERRERRQPYLSAATEMRKRGLCFSRDRIGAVPGVEVGDRFTYRAEMYVIGLHGETRRGIACVSPRNSPYDVLVATSLAINVAFSMVVGHGLMGRYPDDHYDPDKVVYSGEGPSPNPRPLQRPPPDQRCVSRNAALVNSYKRHIPIRLVRRFNDNLSKTGFTYVYDGMYKIKEAKYEKGVLGNKVYKFELIRLSEQASFGHMNNGHIRINSL